MQSKIYRRTTERLIIVIAAIFLSSACLSKTAAAQHRSGDRVAAEFLELVETI